MLPHSIQPMLVSPAAEPFDSKNHIFEVKWDGIRCLAFVAAGAVRLQSRRLLDLTEQFPELDGLNALPSGTVLDGELVVLKDGRPSLNAILERAPMHNQQRRQWLSRSMPAAYIVFDMLYVQGCSLIHEPLIRRRAHLEKLLRSTKVQNVCASEAVQEFGRDLFASVAQLRLEGIVAKYISSPYLPGKRSRHWLKIKPKARSTDAKPLLICPRSRWAEILPQSPKTINGT